MYNLIRYFFFLVDENQLPKRSEIYEGDEQSFTIQIYNQDTYPRPTYHWYINNEPIDPPTKIENDGLKHIMTYTGKLEHSGKTLSCNVIQTDDENHETIHTLNTILSINENISEEGIPVAIISGVFQNWCTNSTCSGYLILLIIFSDCIIGSIDNFGVDCGFVTMEIPKGLLQ